MNIVELLNSESVEAEIKSTTKDNVLAEMTDVLLRSAPGLNRNEVLTVLRERERLGSTGIGEGVAIPHGKLKDIDQLILSFGRSKAGVDFDSMDGKPAHLFFLLLAPEDSISIHLKTLARISKLLKDQDVREQLLTAGTADDIYKIIQEKESV
ncbi:MAG: PTS fructose transporter subunit IIA [Desulfuromonadales bacterium C00003068]|jgi:PTS system nitrogen regulatory IIA component|nr:PTS sugar transporter subunit IIA [Deltaproteobacteria bacterium]OEU75261.1 MAG: PTS fructose transporter subunit IIA [Desulfuromonadales bacterium C00003068]